MMRIEPRVRSRLGPAFAPYPTLWPIQFFPNVYLERRSFTFSKFRWRIQAEPDSLSYGASGTYPWL